MVGGSPSTYVKERMSLLALMLTHGDGGCGYLEAALLVNEKEKAVGPFLVCYWRLFSRREQRGWP